MVVRIKVRESGKVINKTVYLCVWLNNRGYKEVLGVWIGKAESSSFWMSVLTDLKARGVEDILITVTDKLNGFIETICAVFPQSTTQICVVHQTRNSCGYVVWKGLRKFTADMKEIFTSVNRDRQPSHWNNLSKNGVLNIAMSYKAGIVTGTI